MVRVVSSLVEVGLSHAGQADGQRAAAGLAPWALFVFAGLVVSWLFGRRIGGKGGGADGAHVGAWWLLAAVVVAVLVAARA